MEKEKLEYEVIKVLNSQGLRIVRIDQEIFSCSQFYPADKNIPYHKVIGKHITKLILDNLNMGLQGNNLLKTIQTIERLPEREIHYSRGTVWSWFIK